MSKSYAAGYTAIPNEIESWAIKLSPWVWPAVQRLFRQAKGDHCDITAKQLQSHLATLPHARTREGTIPCRTSIWRMMEAMRALGYIVTDAAQNTRQGYQLIELARWVKNALRTGPKNRVQQVSATGVYRGKTDPGPDRVQQVSATPSQDVPLSEESRAIRARCTAAAYAALGRKTPNTGFAGGLAC